MSFKCDIRTLTHVKFQPQEDVKCCQDLYHQKKFWSEGQGESLYLKLFSLANDMVSVWLTGILVHLADSLHDG